jgi:hypothetical protein
MTRHLHARRLALVSLVGAVASVTFASAASAAWTKPGTGSGTGAALTLGTPTNVVVPSSVTNGSVSVSWTGITAPAGASITYQVDRKSGSTYAQAGGTCAGAATSPCNDTGVANGSYQYRVTAKLGSSSWTRASTDSGTVDVTSAGTTLTISSFTVQSGHAAQVTGTAAYGTTGDATTVTVIYCKTTGVCTAGNTLQTQTATVNQTSGAFSTLSGNLGNNQVTYVRVTQARTSGTLSAQAGPITV